MTAAQPEIRWERTTLPNGGVLVRATHDPEPCVYIDGQCSCGRLDLGLILTTIDAGLPPGTRLVYDTPSVS